MYTLFTASCEGDVKAALRGLPKFLTAERAILGALQRNGGNAWLQVRPAAASSPWALRP